MFLERIKMVKKSELKKRLEQIARFERGYGIVGVCMIAEPGKGNIKARHTAGHLCEIIKEAVTLNHSGVPRAKDVANIPSGIS